jgi:hypothetical protein
MKKGLGVVYFAVSLILLGTVESQAYLDPSTSTYVIQIVAGGLIAAGTAVGIFFHKFKKTVIGKKDKQPVKDIGDRKAMEEGKTLTAEDILAMAEEKKEK